MYLKDYSYICNIDQLEISNINIWILNFICFAKSVNSKMLEAHQFIRAYIGF